jgi:hypothetical protein
MADPKKRLHAWIIVASVWSAFQTFLGFARLLFADEKSAPIYWVFFALATPAWAGVVLAIRGHYSAARVLLWIGGILGLPLGLILIRAGNRIKQAADANPAKRSYRV